MGGTTAGGGIGEPAANGDKPEEQQFDPSRMIGIIKRKALIKELAGAYYAECVACCKELLQLQRKWEEGQKSLNLQLAHVIRVQQSLLQSFSVKKEKYVEAKMPEEPKLSSMKPHKRRKR